MNRRAQLSQQARREIAGALRGMEHASAQQALRLALEAAVRRLGEHPFLGRAAPPYVPEPFRFWSLPRFGYLLVYDPQTDPVQILRFVHTRQDLPRALADLRNPTGSSERA